MSNYYETDQVVETEYYETDQVDGSYQSEEVEVVDTQYYETETIQPTYVTPAVESIEVVEQMVAPQASYYQPQTEYVYQDVQIFQGGPQYAPAQVWDGRGMNTAHQPHPQSGAALAPPQGASMKDKLIYAVANGVQNALNRRQ